VGLYQVRSGGFDFGPAGPLLYREEIAIPVRPDRPQLLADIDRALGIMREQGELEKLRERWFGGSAAVGVPDRSMPTSVIVRKLLRGFAVTIGVAVVSILIGLLLAIPVGAVLHGRRGVLYYVLRLVDDFIRATPLLIQLFFIYFGAPQVGITLRPIQAAVVTLSINAAAYMAEVVRAGLMAVPDGQRLAARALGLTPWQSFRLVVWPQAFRVAIPPLMNSVVALAKDTALISVIAVGEVIREAQSIISVTYNPLKYYFIAAAMFFIVTFPLMKLADRLETRLAARGFSA
jgi:polar amino acid transport system permease protein